MSAIRVLIPSGGSVLGLLGVVFVTLRLAGVIDWSWWWVTAPLWVVPVAMFAGMLLGGIFAAVMLLGLWVALWMSSRHHY